MTGTTIAQAIPIAISPILTRLYTPEDFGVLALFISIVAIVSVVSCGRYELAIMLPKKDEDAINIVALAFILNLITNILFFIFLLLFKDDLLNLFNAEALKDWIFLAPLASFIIGVYSILNYTNNRFKFYKDIAKANIYKSIVTAIFQLIFGFFKLAYIGLISGQILGQLSGNVKLFVNIFSRDLLKYINKYKMKEVAVTYIKFPLYSSLSGLLNTMGYQISNILINALFNSTILGNFYLANRILGIPTLFIGSSIAQVFYQKANEEKILTGKAYNTFRTTLKKLIILSFILFFPLFLFIKPLFVFVFGPKWEKAGLYAMILIPMFAIRFISSSLSLILSIFQKQQIELLINAYIIISTLIPIIIFKNTFVNVVIAQSILLSIGYLSFLIYYKLLAEGKIK